MLLTLWLVCLEMITSPPWSLPLSSVAVYNLYVCAQTALQVN